jgi:hypothetical protein
MAHNTKAVTSAQEIVDELVLTINTIMQDVTGQSITTNKERTWAVTGAVTYASRILIRLGMGDAALEVMNGFRDAMVIKQAEADSKN